MLNVILFSLAFTISCIRYTFYSGIWTVMWNDPTNSLFLGTIPMGFATLVEMWVFVCVPAWGDWSRTVAWVFWMLDAIVSVGVTMSLIVKLYVDCFHPSRSISWYYFYHMKNISVALIS